MAGGVGNDRAALCVMQGGFEISDAVVEHVQQAQQLQLVGRVAPLLRNREALVQGHTRRFAVAAREHQ
jgi:hypothetical protein